ncbi:MAG: hypothetical protein A2189_03025 [Paenibacillus sp. RIFOXYA1_FULL_44_5]|nr:MAG: hypothetical protein A2189_03025 [Paenibacillus sp. RIFOXYA1_FULL_44_5]
MMIGTYRWNLWLGSIGFLLTFILSFSQNLLQTALVNSFYGFTVMFVISYGLRWFIGFALTDKKQSTSRGASQSSQIDLSTPSDEESMAELIRRNLSAGKNEKEADPSEFSPLNPPKIQKKMGIDSAELAKAVRHMTED